MCGNSSRHRSRVVGEIDCGTTRHSLSERGRASVLQFVGGGRLDCVVWNPLAHSGFPMLILHPQPPLFPWALRLRPDRHGTVSDARKAENL